MNTLMRCVCLFIWLSWGVTNGYDGENMNNACFLFENEFKCSGHKRIDCYWKYNQCITRVENDIHLVYVMDVTLSFDVDFENKLRDITSASSIIDLFYHNISVDPSVPIQNPTQRIITILYQIRHSQNIFLVLLNANEDLLCPVKKFMDSTGLSAAILVYESQPIARDISCANNADRVYIFTGESHLSKISWDLHSIARSNKRYLLQTPTNETDFVNPNCVDTKDILDVIFLIDNSCGLNKEECGIQSQGILDLILSVKVDDISPRIALLEYGIFNTDITGSIDVFANRTCNPLSGYTDLSSGIEFARHYFETIYRDTTEYHKLVIISNCADETDDVCNALLNINNDTAIPIDVIAININGSANSDIQHAHTYLECITDDIYPVASLEDTSFDEILISVSNDICSVSPICWQWTDSRVCNNEYYQTSGCLWNSVYESCRCVAPQHDVHILYFMDISTTAAPNQTYFNHIASFLDDRNATIEAEDVYLYDNRVRYPNIGASLLTTIDLNEYVPRSRLSNITLAIQTAVAEFDALVSMNRRNILVLFSGQKQSDYTAFDSNALCEWVPRDMDITLLIYAYTVDHDPVFNISCLINDDTDSADAYTVIDYHSIMHADTPSSDQYNAFLDAKYSWDICNAVQIASQMDPYSAITTAAPQISHPTTEKPTSLPTQQPLPTTEPTPEPTPNPTRFPTASPHKPTKKPTFLYVPSRQPTAAPSNAPTQTPTSDPTVQPTTNEPTVIPTLNPTINPSSEPTPEPTPNPTSNPSSNPSTSPTMEPTSNPTLEPTSNPSFNPSTTPTMEPTFSPTIAMPSVSPTIEPTQISSLNPSQSPSHHPSAEPIPYPTRTPSRAPFKSPANPPTYVPSQWPSYKPTKYGMNDCELPYDIRPCSCFLNTRDCDPLQRPDCVWEDEAHDAPYALITDSKSWQQADVYCLEHFGTHLVSIIDDHDMTDAVSSALDENLVWIGLSSHKEPCETTEASLNCQWVHFNGNLTRMNVCNFASYGGVEWSYMYQCKPNRDGVTQNWYKDTSECSGVASEQNDITSNTIDFNCDSDAICTNYVQIKQFDAPDHNCKPRIDYYHMSDLIVDHCFVDAHHTGQLITCNPHQNGYIVQHYHGPICSDEHLWKVDEIPQTFCGDSHTFQQVQECVSSPAPDIDTIHNECMQWIWIDGTPCQAIRSTPLPTINPTQNPIHHPTISPVFDPTNTPIRIQTAVPTFNPIPVSHPTPERPTSAPTETDFQTISPTLYPTNEPTVIPTVHPTLNPSGEPSVMTTRNPSSNPTIDPTIEPTSIPTSQPTLYPTSSPTVAPTGSPIIDVPALPLNDMNGSWINMNGIASPMDRCNIWAHGGQVRSYMYSCDDEDGAVQNWFMDTADCSGHYYSEIHSHFMDYNCERDTVVSNTLQIKQYNLPECHIQTQNDSYYKEVRYIVDHCIRDSTNASYLYQCSSNGGYIIHTYDDTYCTESELQHTQYIDAIQCIGDKVQQVLECNSDHTVFTNHSVETAVSALSVDTRVNPVHNPIVCWSNANEALYTGYYDANWNGIPGDVCDHTDSDIGEVRDTCYFEVKVGQLKWKRSCIHHVKCPNNGSMGCSEDHKEVKCCCDSDYCNQYMDEAMKGYVALEDANIPSPTKAVRGLLSQNDPHMGMQSCTSFWRDDVDLSRNYNQCAGLAVKEKRFIPLYCDEPRSFLCNKEAETRKTGVCRSRRTMMEPSIAPIWSAKCDDMDIIFIVDIGCMIDGHQCQNRQNALSEMILSLKQLNASNINIGYVVYTQNFGLTTIHLNDYDYNTNVDELVGSIQRQFCYIPGKGSIHAGIDEAIHEFELNGTPSNKKRIILSTGCMDEDMVRDPCAFTHYGTAPLMVSGHAVEFMILNTVGHTESTIVDPYHHLSCLSMSDDALFVLETYDMDEWIQMIRKLRNTMCGIDISPSTSPSKAEGPLPSAKPATVLPTRKQNTKRPTRKRRE